MNANRLTLFLISAATLAFQVALTRLFALAQGSHLAFMAVSLALLGIGASGSYLSLKPVAAPNLRRFLRSGTMLFALSTPAAYLAVNLLPFDAYRLAWERMQWVWLASYYLALTVPFFFSGLVVGAALAAEPEQAGPTYAANLLGAGLGPPLALLALAVAGGTGTIFWCALLGWLAAGVSLSPIGRPSPLTSHLPRPTSYVLLPYTLVALTLLYFTFSPPALFDIRLTPYKSLSQALLYPGSEVIFSRWNAFARVDVVRSDGVRSAPGLSFAYTGPLPPQLGLLVDGDNLTPITQPGPATLSRYLPLTLGFELRPQARTLILEPGGGLAVLVALQNGAGAVTVIQSNQTVIEAVGQHFADFNDKLYHEPRVTVIHDEPRSFLRRSGQQFDLIILPLTDSFRPVTAGAYTLNENYSYTVEAFGDALAHLSPRGVLLVERWLQLPPTESLRLWGTMVAALRRAHALQSAAPLSPTDPGLHLLAVRSLQTSLVGAARSPLSTQDLAAIRDFATRQQFDLVWLPDIQPAEANRYSIVPEAPYYHTFSGLLAAPDPAAFFATYPYAVEPPTDDHPFFFHFFKWSQTPEIIGALGKTWQPFGGSGYLVLVILLVLAAVLSAMLILLPLLGSKLNRSATGGGSRTTPRAGENAPSRSTTGGGSRTTPRAGENAPSRSVTGDESQITPRAGENAPSRSVTGDESQTTPRAGENAPSRSATGDESQTTPRAGEEVSPWPALLYFALLGLGFLFVEIPLLQRFILYLGQPAYAFAVVISALLVASGLGSGYLAGRLPLRLTLPLVVLLTILYPFLLPSLFETTLPFPFLGRVAVTVIALFPLGLLLGIPFPGGLALVGRTAPELIPWVWAVNGCASVISAILAAMIALTWGFSAVLWSAALAYAAAGLALARMGND